MKTFLYFLSLLIILSCSSSSNVVSKRIIQKHKYTKGYKIIKNQNLSFKNLLYKSKKENKNTTENKKIKFIDVESTLIASNKNSTFFRSESSKKLIPENNILITSNKNHKSLKKYFKLFQKKTSVLNALLDCDLIIMRNGSEIRAKILEITQVELKYKNCNNLEGPTFTKSLSDIFKIKYTNGSVELIKSVRKENKKNIKYRQDVAIGLWAFWLFGLCGLHRIYLGYYGTGILYLLTGGFCLIGTIIDIFKIVNGTLGPKNGDSYYDF